MSGPERKSGFKVQNSSASQRPSHAVVWRYTKDRHRKGKGKKKGGGMKTEDDPVFTCKPASKPPNQQKPPMPDIEEDPPRGQRLADVLGDVPQPKACHGQDRITSEQPGKREASV